MTIPERIDALLEERGMSRRQLAIKAKIPPSSFQSAMERGKNITIDMIQAVADALEVSPTFIVGQDELQQTISDLIATTEEKDWVRRASTNEGVVDLPLEFNELDRFMESIGYRIIPQEGQYYIVRLGDEKNGIPVTVEELRELVRTSKATVGALVKSLMEKAAQNPSNDGPSET